MPWSCCSRHSLPVGERTVLMGIVNLSPDSFSGDGVATKEDAIARALQLIDEGADILDLGGESTRPGSLPISVDEEMRRVLPVVEELLSRGVPVPLSIDTYKPLVARRVLEAGACVINDIFGLRQPEMAEVLAERGACVVVMHMQGTPQTMQQNPHYDDCVAEIAQFLKDQTHLAIAKGISRERIIVDPGIGFGKTVDHNLEILRRLPEIKALGFPVLVGPSRKSFIGKILNIPNPQERIWGTAAAVAVAISRGADIIRVHDVAEMKQVATVVDALSRSAPLVTPEQS
ncbi:MAG: dihydropteroate synthase [Armatimonadetes bacterium]|nr:dihydropteroate synthase [Armatimonadota bacterium]MDW8121529.1 dihydropteroate synthase [Armatimonadota bacterium]